MNNIPPNLKSALSSRDTASRLARIGDTFHLSEKQRRLQARILAKIMTDEIKVADLPRILRINLNLSPRASSDLSRVIEDMLQQSSSSKIQDKTSIPGKPNKEPLQEKQASASQNNLLKSDTFPKKPDLLKLGAGAIRDFVDRTLGDLNLKLSPLQKSRLESSVLIYIKDIRDELETEDALIRSEERGGVGISQEKAAQIIQHLKDEFPEDGKVAFLNHYKKEESSPQGKIYPPIPEEMQPSILEAKKILESIPQSSLPEQVISPAIPHFPENKVFEEREMPGAKDFMPAPEPSPSPKVIEEIKPVPPPLKKEEQKTLVTDVLQKLESHPVPGKQNAGLAIEMIKNVNDIENLGLENFKIHHPSEAVSRLVTKINNLVGKSELVRFQSIEAWRKSEPYKLYITIGGESIAQGKTIIEIAKRRIMQGEPYLTEEEFNAIADASREFQY